MPRASGLGIKMFKMEQKLCKGTKNVLLWYIVVIAAFALYGLMWPRMILMLLFTAMSMHGLVCPSLVWPCMALYGLFMALNGILWSLMEEYRLFSRS